jgi:multidrug efflux system membrane fusion protein
MKIVLSLLAIILGAGAVALGLHFYNASAQQAATTAAAATAARPPAQVVVSTLALRKVRLWSEFSGRLHAIDYAEIRPQVSGVITDIKFADGQMVKQGDLLFVIDPRPYEDAVERDQAALVSAQSKVTLAKIQSQRYAGLIATHSVSQDELDSITDADRTAEANEANAEAVLKQAKLDLEHAYVTAPISGRVSRAEITQGNLVQTLIGAPIVTTIVSQDGIYADFDVDEQTYLQTVRASARDSASEHKVPVQLVVQGDNGHVYTGFIESFDNRIDPTSDTIRARARFANTDGALVPGMFVTVRLSSAADQSVLLVPQRAISFDQSKASVLVVDDSNKVGYRQVELGKTVESNRVVTSGLQAGDRVIVDGVQLVRTDDQVVATEMPAEKNVANIEPKTAVTP